MEPYSAIAPQVSITAKNGSSAYGSKVSEALDFSRPDATGGRALLNILAHNHEDSVRSPARKHA